MGGLAKDANYEAVCGKKTDHVEVVHVRFDPKLTSLERILDVFYRAHDPTDAGGQGADRGHQYLPSIWAHSKEQKEASKAVMAQWNEELKGKLATALLDAMPFYAAEEYHQKYWDKNGATNGYCRAVIAPKMRKFGLA